MSKNSRETLRQIEEETRKFRETSKEIEVEGAFFENRGVYLYLNENSDKNSRPFKCPYLIVVPEDLTFVSNKGRSMQVTQDYRKGELVCTVKGGYPYCTIAKQRLEPDENGNTHLRCKNMNFALEVKVVSVNQGNN